MRPAGASGRSDQCVGECVRLGPAGAHLSATSASVYADPCSSFAFTSTTRFGDYSANRSTNGCTRGGFASGDEQLRLAGAARRDLAPSVDGEETEHLGWVDGAVVLPLAFRELDRDRLLAR